MSSQIIGLGGGGFTMEENPLLDLYIVSCSDKKTPKVCFLPTASGDNVGYIQEFNKVFSRYGCKPYYLGLISPRIQNIEDFLMSMDIIYVGGGNSKSMLALWREWGVDKILAKAYKNGTILAGVSAGFVCWFEQCITDSIPDKMTVMSCLGLIKGSGSPHFGSSQRQNAYHKFLKNKKVMDGFAADDCAALHFIDGKLHRAVSSHSEAKAYRMYIDNVSEKSVQEPLPIEFLGTEESYNKYIQPLIHKIYGDYDKNDNESSIDNDGIESETDSIINDTLEV